MTDMTKDQAHATRTARGNEARLLSRKSKAELVAIYQSEGGYGGGDWTKVDLEMSVLAIRYPVARDNEAVHVLYHDDVVWDGCGFCHD